MFVSWAVISCTDIEVSFMSNQQNFAHLWHSESGGGLELLRARFVAFAFTPHAHEEYMIAVTGSGNGAPRFQGGVKRVGPDDVIILNPGEVHDGGTARDSVWHYRAFYPPVELMQRISQELTGVEHGIPEFGRSVINDPQMVAALWRAHLAQEQMESALMRDSYLHQALALLLSRYGEGKLSARHIGSEHQSVRLAKAYLEASPGENVSLDTLAHEAGLSPYYLCRVFRRETGLSPHAYQVLVRVRLAKSLLGQGLPIAQAALEAGFFDQAHLTKHFKRIFGVTPGQYQWERG
jgi:AraC-like DNA-binding protein